MSQQARQSKVSAEAAQIVHERTAGLCCNGCGSPIASGPIGLHHVFPKHRWPYLIEEVANLVGVCVGCHAAHENASKRLSRRAVRCAESLVLDPSMERYLDRVYGPRDGR